MPEDRFSKRWQVWRLGTRGAYMLGSFEWKWVARLYALLNNEVVASHTRVFEKGTAGREMFGRR